MRVIKKTGGGERDKEDGRQEGEVQVRVRDADSCPNQAASQDVTATAAP